MMTKEGSTKIVTFMTPMQGWGSDVRCGHISHVLSSTLSIYSTLIAIVLRDFDADYVFDHRFSFIL